MFLENVIKMQFWTTCEDSKVQINMDIDVKALKNLRASGLSRKVLFTMLMEKFEEQIDKVI